MKKTVLEVRHKDKKSEIEYTQKTARSSELFLILAEP